MTVTTDGDVTIVGTNRNLDTPSGTSWFKIKANGTGTVSFASQRTVSRTRCWSYELSGPPFQSISNFSTTPDSGRASPYPSDLGVLNHRVTFSDVNLKTLSFDYTCH